MSTSGWLVRHKGIVLMISTSKRSKVFSSTSVFHCLCSASINEHTFARNNASGQGDNTLGEYLLGNQLSAHMSTNYPSPIRHIAHFFMTSLPLIILRHAYEAELGLVASIIVLVGKNFDLNTL